VFCGKGEYNKANATTDAGCAGCPSGYHQPYKNQYKCSSSGLECPPGRYKRVVQSGFWPTASCCLCLPGYYQPRRVFLATQGCIACPPGKAARAPDTSAQVAASRCYACSVGFYQNSAHAVLCLACSAGLYQDQGVYATIAGVPGGGAKACKACPAGYYQGQRHANRCRLCSVAIAVEAQEARAGVARVEKVYYHRDASSAGAEGANKQQHTLHLLRPNKRRTECLFVPKQRVAQVLAFVTGPQWPITGNSEPAKRERWERQKERNERKHGHVYAHGRGVGEAGQKGEEEAQQQHQQQHQPTRSSAAEIKAEIQAAIDKSAPSPPPTPYPTPRATMQRHFQFQKGDPEADAFNDLLEAGVIAMPTNRSGRPGKREWKGTGKGRAAYSSCKSVPVSQLNTLKGEASPEKRARAKPRHSSVVSGTLNAAAIVKASHVCNVCESAHLINGSAVFLANDAAGGATVLEHQKLFEWPLATIEASYSSFSARIDFEGHFKGCGTECDIVVGLSDGHNVWAVGRGDEKIGLDVLRPFPDGRFRPCAGNFYDTFAKRGGRQAVWHALISFDKDKGVALSLWNKGSPVPDTQLFYSSTYFAQPDGVGPHLKIVVFRDDPPQRYGVASIKYKIHYTQNSIPSAAAATTTAAATTKTIAPTVASPPSPTSAPTSSEGLVHRPFPRMITPSLPPTPLPPSPPPSPLPTQPPSQPHPSALIRAPTPTSSVAAAAAGASNAGEEGKNMWSAADKALDSAWVDAQKTMPPLPLPLSSSHDGLRCPRGSGLVYNTCTSPCIPTCTTPNTASCDEELLKKAGTHSLHTLFPSLITEHMRRSYYTHAQPTPTTVCVVSSSSLLITLIHSHSFIHPLNRACTCSTILRIWVGIGGAREFNPQHLRKCVSFLPRSVPVPIIWRGNTVE
jgi:hypothetical protein